MPEPLTILLLEDSPTDAELVQRLLNKEFPGSNCILATNKSQFLHALQHSRPQLVLADNSLPGFNGTEALQNVKMLQPHLPFILVTGTMSEEFAAGIIKKGADDYILKDRLTRLPAAIDAALKQKQFEKDKTDTEKHLLRSEEKYRTLVEHAFDGIIIYSINGVILDCNHSTCHYLGYTQEELKTLNVKQLFMKEDLAARPLYFDTLLAGEATIDYRKLKRKDGSCIEMEIGTKMMPDGNLMAIGRDITERKKAAAQQALFASIINSSDDAIISKTTEGIITSWNNGATRLFGYEATEAIGRHISMIIPPELAHEETMIIDTIKNGESLQHYETERLRKDGSRVYISLTESPVKNSRGIVTGASKIARDISERKEAEQKLVQSEENLKAIFESSSEGFILTDTEGLVKVFNYRAGKSIFNFFSKQITTGSSVFEYTEPARRAQFRHTFATVLTGETVQYERSYTSAAGNEIWISFTFTPVKKNKIIHGVCITAHDVTEKRKAEQQKEFDRNNLHALINNTQDLIWSVDRNFKLITFNKATEEMAFMLTGRNLASREDLFAAGFDDDLQKRYKRYYERAFTGEAFTEIEYSIHPYEYWSENSFYPIYEGEKVIGTACFSRNITERKKAEEMVRRSFEEKQALATRMAAILNTLPANIALLDERGIIIEVNDAWRQFAVEMGFRKPGYGIGDNYIAASVSAAGMAAADGKAVAAGIQDLIENAAQEFVFEYACQAPGLNRWYRMIATRLQHAAYTGAVVMHIDISELKRLEQERLESKMMEQKKITQAMVLAQERERNELGQELHDNISQLLAAIRMKLSFHIDKIKTHTPLLEGCIQNLDEAVAETRNLSHRMLMPRFKDSSFQESLKDLARKYKTPLRKVRVNASHYSGKDILPCIPETLYRIAQEQLHNIEKYARASLISISLRSAGKMVYMKIEDNGIGFDTRKKRNGIGLTNIMNRIESFDGKVQVVSEPGRGCALLVEIPMPENGMINGQQYAQLHAE